MGQAGWEVELWALENPLMSSEYPPHPPRLLPVLWTGVLSTLTRSDVGLCWLGLLGPLEAARLGAPISGVTRHVGTQLSR